MESQWTVLGYSRLLPWLGRWSPRGRLFWLSKKYFGTVAEAKTWVETKIVPYNDFVYGIVTFETESEIVAKLPKPKACHDHN